MMKTEVTSRELAKLLALKSREITDLVKREIIVSGSKRGSYKLQESIRNYVEYLRKLATAPVSEETIKQATIERTKPVAAQADLAKTTAERMRGDMVLTSDLEEPGTELSSLHDRIPGVDDNRGHPVPHAHARLTKRVRSFRIYIGDGRCYTVWDKWFSES
jgi:phage terminase Nu1 subunit (DNA packaging protein)